jgi:hypothetical protein
MTPLHENIVKTLAYFDVFSYPLSAEQVYSSLQTNSVTPKKIEEELRVLSRRAVINAGESYYFLKHRDSQIVAHRLKGERQARKLLSRAKIMTWIIKQFPFVRCVCLSGELSKNVAGEKSDVDFFIITAPHRLWICRALLTLFKKIFLLNKRKYFCLNYFLAEDSLTVENQNLFTAIETATLKVMWSAALFEKFIAANPWVNRFLPNWKLQLPSQTTVAEQRSPLQKAAETLLNFLSLDIIDERLMKAMKQVWRKRYRNLSEEKLNELFQSTRSVSTAYGHDYQKIILHEYHRRLKMYGIAGTDG